MKSKKYDLKTETALSSWVKLARAYSTIYKRAQENIRSYGLTLPQLAVIEALGHLGPLKVGKICEKMLVSGGNMTLVLDNLEKLKYVKRLSSKKDRRSIEIILTPKGKKVFDKYFLKHADYITDLFSVLSVKEQKQLSSLLKKLGVGITQSK